DEIYRVTTSFLQGEVAAFSHSRKKAPMPWRQPEGGNKPNFKKGFKNKQRSNRKPDRFPLLTKTPKEMFALEKGKFKAPPPMVTPAEKRDPNKYYEFHADTGHITDECMQLGKQIEGSQGKGYPELLSGDSNLLSAFRRGRWNGRTNDHRSRNRRTLRAPDIRRRRSVLRGSIRTLLRQAPARNKKPNDPRQNLDVFAWKPADMPGIPRHIAEHRLNIREGCLPIRQKKKGQAPERNKAIQEEVEKLVDAGIMKEVHYHSWLFNPVMVKKHDGSWRMCVDFKDLNKAYPKDGYPLPEINWKV
ncbi:hypothetical protein Tco_1388943, partial [Tanacetum coccineum]